MVSFRHDQDVLHPYSKRGVLTAAKPSSKFWRTAFTSLRRVFLHAKSVMWEGIEPTVP